MKTVKSLILLGLGVGIHWTIRRINQRNQQRQQANQNEQKRKQRQQRKLFLNFVDKTPRLENFRKQFQLPLDFKIYLCVLIGKRQVGKSSIYNWCFDLKLKPGLQQTTKQLEKVHSDEETKKIYYNSPGFSQQESVKDYKKFRFFYKVNQVFILEDRSFKNCQKQLMILNKIDPSFWYIVRTKCDQFSDKNLFREVVKKDREYLDSIGINKKVLYISARKGPDFRDNKMFKQKLKFKHIPLKQ